MRRDFKETRSKSCLQTSRLETLTFFNKVYFFFDQYIIRGCSLSISFCSRCSFVNRLRGFTLKTPFVIVCSWSWAYVFKSGGKTCGSAWLTLVSLVFIVCTFHSFCVHHSSTDAHKITSTLTSGVSVSVHRVSIVGPSRFFNNNTCATLLV